MVDLEGKVINELILLVHLGSQAPVQAILPTQTALKQPFLNVTCGRIRPNLASAPNSPSILQSLRLLGDDGSPASLADRKDTATNASAASPAIGLLITTKTWILPGPR